VKYDIVCLLAAGQCTNRRLVDNIKIELKLSFILFINTFKTSMMGVSNVCIRDTNMNPSQVFWSVPIMQSQTSAF